MLLKIDGLMIKIMLVIDGELIKNIVNDKWIIDK